MLLTLGGLLGPDDLTQMRRALPQLTWRDGAQTAGRVARAVKKNSQADLSSKAGAALRERLEAAIQGHRVLNSAARPARFSPILISRTELGGGYGVHVDNAFMGTGEDRIRTDLSYTLFLSEPEDYEGGALVIDLPGAQQSVKLRAGDAVLYPSTALHAVAPVREGKRIVCVGWIESLVPDAGDRELLFDLENLKVALADSFDAQSAERLMAQKVFSNLLRRLTR